MIFVHVYFNSIDIELSKLLTLITDVENLRILKDDI